MKFLELVETPMWFYGALFLMSLTFFAMEIHDSKSSFGISEDTNDYEEWMDLGIIFFTILTAVLVMLMNTYD